MAIAVGAAAPEFTLKDQSQKEVKLSDFKGKKNVVLVFYPLDWSPVCTNEHMCFVNDMKKFEQLDAQVLGLSVDSRSFVLLVVPLFLWWIFRNAERDTKLSSLLWFVAGFVLGTLPSITHGLHGGESLGALAGGFLFDLFGASGVTGLNLYSMIVAIVGSVVVLLIYNAVTGRRRV